MESATRDLGRNVRRIRETRGRTQEGLGVSRNYVASLEVGRIANPGVFTLYPIAQTLGVRMETLMGAGDLPMAPARTRRPERFTLSDAQRELEARLAMVGAAPWDRMTPAQADAFIPRLVDQRELVDASGLAVANHLDRSLVMAPEWAATGWWSAGVLAMALVVENSHSI